jgi:DHA1 family tetracycline resistance protein-like MFS transporter
MNRRALSRQLDILSTVFIVALVDALALTLIIPMLPSYGVRLGGDALAISAVAAAYPLAQLIGALLMGSLSDRFGRKPLLIASLLGSFAGYIVMALAQSIEMLILARLIDGLSGGNVAVAYATLADSTEPEERSRVFGMVVGSAFGIAFIVGPFVGIAVLSMSGRNYALVSLVAALYSLLAVGIVAKLLPETRPKTAATPGARDAVTINSRVVVLLVILALQQFAFGGFERMFGLFNLSRLGMGAEATGYLFIYIGLITVWAQARALPMWRDRFGDLAIVVHALTGLAIGLALLAITPTIPAPWYDRSALAQSLLSSDLLLDIQATTRALSIMLPEGEGGWLGLIWLVMALLPVALGGAVLRPVLSSMISCEACGGRAGATLGISAAVVSLMNAAAPLVGGLAFTMSTGTPFILSATAAVAGLAIAVLLMRKPTIATAIQRSAGR